MDVLRTIKKVRRWRKADAGRTALVPTMGALHAGHLEHVAAVRSEADRVAVSIFVNPTQFGPREDFTRYPRPVEDDLSKCEEAGVDAVFLPDAEAMYPSGIPAAAVDMPGLTTEFEGAERPGHFAGVCRVVMKLLNIVQPDVVTFGQKDYQQLVVCSGMIADLHLPVDVLPVPTVREPDGLALSSRNVYLDADQRRRALGLIKALRLATAMIHDDGETDPETVEHAMRQVLASHQVETDYAAIRHPTTLQALDSIDARVVALVAGRLGSTRLLDNMMIEPAG